MTPRALEMPAAPEAVEEAVATLTAHLREEPDDARAGEQFQRLAWRWARQVAAADEAERVYAQMLAHAGLGTEPGHEPAPERQAAPKSTVPMREPTPTERGPESPPPPDSSDGAEPEPLPSVGLSGPEAERARALADHLADAPAQIAGPIPRWDPDETPVLVGRVEAVEHADLRQRAGTTRVLLLKTEEGLVECWLGHQQSAAITREFEAEQGRAVAPGDVFAIAAKGRKRIGKSRSPSRLFSIEIEWGDDA